MPHIGQPDFGAKAIQKRSRVSVLVSSRLVLVVVAVVVGVATQSRVCEHPQHPMTTISSTFESFREHLDEHHDRRDRLIKVHRRLFYAPSSMYGSSSLDLGQPRYISGVQEGRFPTSTDIE